MKKKDDNYRRVQNTCNLFKIRRISLITVTLLMITGFAGASEIVPDTLVRIRFAQPVYDCASQLYSLDVELQSEQANQQLFGINLRFLYDHSVLEYDRIITIPEYSLRSQYRTVLSPFTGPVLFGFEGAAVFFNGYIENNKSGQKILATHDQGWTRLFTVTFRIKEPEKAFGSGQLCPSVVWDMKEDQKSGIITQEGVVMAVTSDKPNRYSVPVMEETLPFNWDYNGLPEPPYGSPMAASCVQRDPIPPVITTLSQSMDLGCNPESIPTPVFTATDNCGGLISLTVTTNDQSSQGCSYLRTWTATCKDAVGNMAIPVSISCTWTQDNEIPVITTPESSRYLGFNPTVVPPVFTCTDNCEGTVTPVVSSAGETNLGSSYSQTWTANYTDKCGNAAETVSITYTWTEGTQTTFTLSLGSGWNLISSYLKPANPDMKAVFQSLINNGSLIKVQDEIGKSLENYGIFGGWINNIGELFLTEGYKVKMNVSSQLTVEGIPASFPFSIPLKAGWNIIGYPLMKESNGMAIVQQLIDRKTLIKVQDELGRSIEDYGSFGGWKNNIGNFKPGKGYKIKVTANETLTFTSSE